MDMERMRGTFFHDNNVSQGSHLSILRRRKSSCGDKDSEPIACIMICRKNETRAGPWRCMQWSFGLDRSMLLRTPLVSSRNDSANLFIQEYRPSAYLFSSFSNSENGFNW